MKSLEAEVRMTLDGQPYFNVEDLGIVCPICSQSDW